MPYTRLSSSLSGTKDFLAAPQESTLMYCTSSMPITVRQSDPSELYSCPLNHAQGPSPGRPLKSQSNLDVFV